MWAGDGNTYRARIKAFRNIGGKRLALVSFQGYGSGDDEWMGTAKLTPVTGRKKQALTPARQVTKGVATIKEVFGTDVGMYVVANNCEYDQTSATKQPMQRI